MTNKRSSELFSAKKTEVRFKAALRGARVAGPQHIQSVAPKGAEPQQKKLKKSSV